MKLLHLYHDIMNLYGDYANVLAVQRVLEKSGEEATIDRMSLGDEPNLSDFDFIFIGSGTEKNQKVVLADFVKYQDQLKDYIASGKPLLMTGNSFEMLGKTITDGDGKTYDGIGLYDFAATEEHGRRYTADVICQAEFLDQPLVGFINKSSSIEGIKTPLFTTMFGLSDHEGGKTEGIVDRHFYGTHLTGPILMKNPHFLVYLCELILGKRPVEDHLEHEKLGYEITLKKLSERKK